MPTLKDLFIINNKGLNKYEKTSLRCFIENTSKQTEAFHGRALITLGIFSMDTSQTKKNFFFNIQHITDAVFFELEDLQQLIDTNLQKIHIQNLYLNFQYNYY